MLHGSIIHCLFQTVMKEGLRDESAVLTVAKSLLRSNKILHDMYGHGVEENVVMEEIKLYIPSLFSWLKKHTEWLGNGKNVVKESDLTVTEIHDIEENFWSPR
ncbi:unnamed protein product [Lymnaea stagnalis]|uniref:DNA replication factor Dna2 N-terminal domain-containing protein n=1 Tax=Lymnaea stagnalis TaxID=6523 RepID=A0AAV2HPY6_LYMST